MGKSSRTEFIVAHDGLRPKFFVFSNEKRSSVEGQPLLPVAVLRSPSQHTAPAATRLNRWSRRTRPTGPVAGAVGIRLYVDEHNEGAQAAYVRLGMHVSNYKVMEVMFGG
mgnify:CR=1 FL=1